MNTHSYNTIQTKQGFPIKAWTRGVLLDESAEQQLKNVAQLPFIHQHIAVMPDVHWGMGATIGSVIATSGAIIPAAVGVDIGCGMMAVQTSLSADCLPDNLKTLRANIEKAVPHGRTHNGGRGDRGSWDHVPADQENIWSELQIGFNEIVSRHPKVGRNQPNHVNHLGTLGTGNHFIEVCLDEKNQVWFMLHSGSRGIGNRIGTYFIELAKEDMRRWFINLPDNNLAYLSEGTEHFADYVFAVNWAQNFARINRELMMKAVIKAIGTSPDIPPFSAELKSVNCHHNYVAREHHFGKNVLVTRKGALRARKNDLGIIPGSMGTCSYIVQGLGNEESFHSCSHGAGRAMSRGQARKMFSIQDHIKATNGVECRKDIDVIDETPAAYKPIDDVMNAQKDLVEILHTLRQVICIKG
ncbi:MAG: RNA-splicing ligase RtcB [Nitrospinae bacterium CG11_big_fil_rev_8_21_14_0_20_45_15]|nr:MAG: RNA-splicing ligase RtcB [Nitrospinae bacterium CG11_big_fil_rev_8_21_14_0_20_45_15]